MNENEIIEKTRQSRSNSVGSYCIWRSKAVKYEPQATAVELAQLDGEGGFPTVWGNVPKGQKGKASFKKGGQAVPLNKGID